MADLELGNIAFNNNANQQLNCPEYIVALLRDIDRQLKRIMWNIYQKEYDNPFENTANTFELGNFKIQAFNWNDEVEQEFNFLYKVDKTKANMPDLKISWYKYLGRDTTINQDIDANVMIDIYNDIIKQLLQYESGIMTSKGVYGFDN